MDWAGNELLERGYRFINVTKNVVLAAKCKEADESLGCMNTVS
jgi:hypothetical protein